MSVVKSEPLLDSAYGQDLCRSQDQEERKQKSNVHGNMSVFPGMTTTISMGELNNDMAVPNKSSDTAFPFYGMQVEYSSTYLESNDTLNLKKDGVGSRFPCSICTKSFKTKQHVKQHESTHFGVKNFECSECNRKFSTVSSMKRHRETHRAERPMFPCTSCGRLFKDSKSVSSHRPCNNVRFPCDQCDRSYTRNDLLKAHKRIHVEAKQFSCPVCAKSFYTAYLLKRHQMSHSLTLPHVCPTCGRAFKDPRSVHTHKPCNKGTFGCDLCGKKFSRIDLLNVHHKVHLGIRPYQCTVCEKQFSVSSSLKRHMEIHSKDRKIFHCSSCGKDFKNHKGYKTHRPCSRIDYRCETCDRSYSRPDLLRQHRKSHLEIKPFSCQMCDKTFISNSQLQRHFKIHSDVKNFPCFKYGLPYEYPNMKPHTVCNGKN